MKSLHRFLLRSSWELFDDVIVLLAMVIHFSFCNYVQYAKLFVGKTLDLSHMTAFPNLGIIGNINNIISEVVMWHGPSS